MYSPKSRSPPSLLGPFGPLADPRCTVRVCPSCSGNEGVWVRGKGGARSARRRRSPRWRYIGIQRFRIVGKLDQSVVEWIVREKRKGVKNAVIAETAKVSARHVQRLWRRYGSAPGIEYPRPMGRPKNGLAGRREHSAVLSAAGDEHSGARALEDIIESGTGIHIPHSGNSSKL